MQFLNSIENKRTIKKEKSKKQKLYNKFLKSKTNKNEKKYKVYKFLFEVLKQKSKKFYYSRKLDSCKQNMKKTWDTMKEVIGKNKTFKNDIPKRKVIDGIETFDQEKIANGFNKYLTVIGFKLASSISTSSKYFKQFMNISKTALQEYTLQDEELEEPFNSLKSNKSPGFDDISSSVVNFCISGIFNPLIFLIFHHKQKFLQMERKFTNF